LEHKDEAVTSEDLGWDRVGGIIALAPGSFGALRTWSGRLQLPRSGGRLRLVVQQFEQFPSDTPFTIGAPPPPVRRLVHQDIVEV